MDGSFNQAAGRGGSAQSPQTPGGNSYQVNVNRTKTRKWVEARVQTYDGDDWGADEFDDDEPEEPEPEPPLPQLPPNHNSSSDANMLPSQAGPSAPYTHAPTSGALPSLNQAQQQAPAISPPAGRPSQAAITSPVLSNPSSVDSAPDRNASPSLVSPYSAEPLSSHAAPQHVDAAPQPTESADQAPSRAAPPFIRPSDIYRRMGEETPQGHQPFETATANPDTTLGSSSDRSLSPSKLSVGHGGREAYDRDDVSDLSHHSYSNLDTIPERQSEYGMEAFTKPSQQHDATGGPRLENPVDPTGDKTKSESPGKERFSSSPKLPDVARMSVFGTDFFSSSLSHETNELPIPSGPVSASADVPSAPQDQAKDSTASVLAPAPPPPASVPEESLVSAQAPATEAAQESSNALQESLPENKKQGTSDGAVEGIDNAENGTSAEDEVHSVNLQQPSLTSDAAGQTAKPEASGKDTDALQAGSNTIAPLRTSNSHESSTSPPIETSVPPVPRSAERNITPTEPLQPRKLDQSAVNFEPGRYKRGDTMSTTASSPLKESDVLSDEILRSLSPGAMTFADAKHEGDKRLAIPGGSNAPRDSTYTLSDYDHYWADTTSPAGDKDSPSTSKGDEPVIPSAPVPDLPDLPIAVESKEVSPVTIPGPQTRVEPTQPARPDARRRFSWEATDDSQPLAQAIPQSTDASDKGPTVATEHFSGIPEQSVITVSPPTQDKEATSQEVPATEKPSLAPITTSVSHQVSKASTAGPPKAVSSLAEPPSPVSVTSDKAATSLRETTEKYLVEDKVLVGSDAVSSVDGQPALASSLSPSTVNKTTTQVMPSQLPAFKDIMGISTAAGRIAKFNETRAAFATLDPGLDNWILSLKQHPEHAHMFSSAGASPSGPAQGGQATASPTGPQPPAQQPYYQQYLNASSPGTSAPSPSRSRLGGLPISTQAAGSAFGHSGNQIGTKSKEFMQSAGKMGKGLLSKGKSKLRGSGDKGESTPPPVQQKTKADNRRTSWGGIGLGAKSRADEDTPHPSGNVDHVRSQSTEAPRLPQPRRMSPFNPEGNSDDEQASKWSAPRPAPEPNRQLSNARQDVFAPLQPINPGGRAWSQQQAGVGGSVEMMAAPDPVNPAADDRSLHDWVVVPRKSEDQVLRDGPASGTLASGKAPASVLPEDSGIAMQPQPQPQPQPSNEEPKRSSSFIGLPPIRRSSTFGLTSKVRRATERFSLDDEDDDADTEEATPTGTRHPEEQAYQNQNAPLPAQGPPRGSGADQLGLSQAPRVEHQHQPQNQYGTLRHNTPPPIRPEQQHHGRMAESAARQAEPPTRPEVVIPFQRLPPSGPWKLEESYLAEPLHQVTRNRSDTAGSQQQVPYGGYDKETGLTILPAPAPPPAPAPLTPTRLRNSDVPPSSAQRYPELFSQPSQQEAMYKARAGPRSPIHPYPGHYQPPLSREEVLFARTEGSEYEIPGVGPPAEERGRPKRQSGIFKDIGSRIARATSRERRPSVTGLRRASTDLRGDEASEYSMSTDFSDRKKRRSSFMFGLGNRASMDQGSDERHTNTLAKKQSPTDIAVAQSQGDRKRSFFGSAASGLSTTQQKRTSGALPRSSTSNLATESQSSLGPSEGGETTPKKKRFSNIAKGVSISNMFNRSGKQDRESHDYSGQETNSRSNSSGPANPPFNRATRRSTGNLDDLIPPEPITAETPGRRSRRGSMSGMISGFIHRRSESRTREETPVATARPPSGQFLPTRLSTSDDHLRGQVEQSQAESRRSFTGGETAEFQVNALNRLSHTSGQQPGPSPLGIDAHMMQGGSGSEMQPTTEPVHREATAERPGSGNELHTSSGVTRSATTEVPDVSRTQPTARSETVVPPQSDVAKDGDLLRSVTVSPDISDDGQVNEQHEALAQHNGRDLSARAPQLPHIVSDEKLNRDLEQSVATIVGLSQQTPSTSQPDQARDVKPDDQEATHSQPSRVSPVPVESTPHSKVEADPRHQAISDHWAAQRQQAMEGGDRMTYQGPAPGQEILSARQYPHQSNTQPPVQQAQAGADGGLYRPPQGHGFPLLASQQPNQQRSQPLTQEALAGNDRIHQAPQGPGFTSTGGQQVHQQNPRPIAQKSRVDLDSTMYRGPSQSQGFSRVGQPSNSPPPPPTPPKQGLGSTSGHAGHLEAGRQAPQAAPPAPESDGQSDHQGFRWKDLRARVTDQMAQIAAQNQDKPGKEDKAEKVEKTEKAEKARTARILGAFRKGSKSGISLTGRQPSPSPSQQFQTPPISQPVQFPGQSPRPAQQQDWNPTQPTTQPTQFPRQNPIPVQQQQWRQMPTSQPAHFPGQSPRQVQPQQQQPQPQPQQYLQHQQPSQQLPQQYAQHVDAQHIPPPGPHDAWQLSVPRQPEPQYDQVPIPQGYSAVHGEGMVAPSPYNVGRYAQQPYVVPGGYLQRQHHQPQFQNPMHRQQSQSEAAGLPYGTSQQPQQPQQSPQSQQFTPPTTDRRVSAASGNIPSPTGGYAAVSPTSRASASNHASPEQRSLSISQVADAPFGDRSSQPRLAGLGLAGTAIPDAPDQQLQDSVRGTHSAGDDLAMRKESQAGSTVSQVSPEITGQSTASEDKKPQSKLGVDVDKAQKNVEGDIYSSAPRIAEDVTGESGTAASQVSQVTSGEPEAAPREAAELEDTEEIRTRTMRIEAQEEKILYDPDEDADEVLMSATSYPGQEWNPYEMSEYADWREE